MTLDSNEILQRIKAKDNSIADEGKWEWKPFYEKRQNKEGNEYIVISYVLLIELLRDLGFRRMNKGGKSHIIRVIDNVAELCDQEKVIDVFMEYLNQFGEVTPDGVSMFKVKEKILKGLSSFFSNQILSRIFEKSDNLEFNNHTKSEAYFYFLNGFAKVTANGVEVLPYSVLDKMIWKNQIIDKELKPTKTQTSGVFHTFCCNIAGNAIDKKTKKPTNIPRFQSLKSVIGYLLHSYFDDELRFMLFTDSRVNVMEADGRSGKTLLLKALSKLLNISETATTFVELNGKDYDPDDKFKYQNLSIDTRLLHINDMRKNFDFEKLFNDITEGIQVQHKNQTPYPVYCKMAGSSNKTVKIEGGSAKARVLEFELADHYSNTYTPKMEFGHWFFRDWSKKEWNSFYNFLLSCVSYYLKHGLIAPEEITLSKRKQLEETCPEFVEFMQGLEIEIGKQYHFKADLFMPFRMEYEFHNLKPNKFSRWLSTYVKYDKVLYDITRRKLGSVTYLTFIEEPE